MASTPDDLSAIARCLFHGVARTVALSLVVVSACAWGVNAPTEEPGSGVVVEEALKNFEADTAGIQAGDVILEWTRNTARGEIQSPFDLADVETEQAQRGAVTLLGLRAGEKKTWTLGANSWRVRVRPMLPVSLLPVYTEARELAKTGKNAETAQLWFQAAIHADPAQHVWLQPWLMLQAADEWSNARLWSDADKAYQAAIESASGAGRIVVVQLWRAWAARFEQRGDLKEAERIYQQALAADPSGENLCRAAVLNRLGILAAQTGRLDDAATQYLRALELRQKLAPGSLDVARTFNNLGLLYQDRGDLEKAELYHSQSLEIRDRVAPDSLDVAFSLGNLGLVFRDRGDLEKSEKFQLRALDIRQKLSPGAYEVTLSLLNLGVLAEDRGDLAAAADYFGKTLEIREKLAPNSLVIAESLNNLGEVARLRGDLIKSEEFYRRALEIRNSRAPGSLDVAASYTNLGAVAIDRGDLDRAEEYFQKGLAIKRKLAPDSMNVARSLNDLGDLAYRRGEYAKALAYQLQALEIRQKFAPGSLEFARSLNNLGAVLYKLGDTQKAERHLREAIKIEDKVAPAGLDLAETFALLATVARNQGAAKIAEDYCRRALGIIEKLVPGSTRHAESLAALASIIHSQGRLEEASVLFGQALDMFEVQAGRLGGAEEIRAGFRAHFNQYYRAYIDVLMRQHKPELAFQVLERSRARSLLEILAEAHVDLRKGADPKLLERERSLQQMLAAQSNRRIRALDRRSSREQQENLEKETRALLAEFQQVESDIRTSSPAYAALTQPSPVDVREVQKELLDPQTILLEYSLGDQRSYLWAVTKSSLSVYPLPKKAVIEAAARALYKQLSLPNLPAGHETQAESMARTEKVAAEFSQMVLGPVAEKVRGKRIVVVADGALEYVPFNVLPAPQSRTVVPLIVEHEIVALPSASVLAVLRREAAGRTAPGKSVAILADPVFDRDDPRVNPEVAANKVRMTVKHPPADVALPQGAERLTRSAKDMGWGTLPRLPFSRREAEAIAKATPGGSTLRALDFAASRATALSPELAQYRVLHFATHGIINNQHPELSGLVLSLVDERGSPQNGFLELHDIYDLNLPIDLVVLSACETGLGKQIRGEGLMGLTRGFMYAGASRVMASMWTVNDAATAELMAKFYRGMERQGLQPAAALRQAQIAIWKQKRWSEPYFWGAFQLQGDWK